MIIWRLGLVTLYPAIIWGHVSLYQDIIIWWRATLYEDIIFWWRVSLYQDIILWWHVSLYTKTSSFDDVSLCTKTSSFDDEYLCPKISSSRDVFLWTKMFFRIAEGKKHFDDSKFVLQYGQYSFHCHPQVHNSRPLSSGKLMTALMSAYDWPDASNLTFQFDPSSHFHKFCI